MKMRVVKYNDNRDTLWRKSKSFKKLRQRERKRERKRERQRQRKKTIEKTRKKGKKGREADFQSVAALCASESERERERERERKRASTFVAAISPQFVFKLEGLCHTFDHAGPRLTGDKMNELLELFSEDTNFPISIACSWKMDEAIKIVGSSHSGKMRL